MVSIPSQLGPITSAIPAWALLLSMLVVSVLLIFAGRTVVKVLAFLVVGLVGASVGGVLAAQFLAGAGTLGIVLGFLLGFVIGGFIGVLLIAVGIGLALGYGAYVLTSSFVSGTTVPLLAGILFFIIGLALYNKILSLVTAVAGGFLFFDVLQLYGLDQTLAVIIAALATLAGIWVQEGLGKRRAAPTTASTAGGAGAQHQ